MNNFKPSWHATQLSRRQLMHNGLVLAAGTAAMGMRLDAFAATSAGRAKPGENPIVKTKLGRLKGFVEGGNVYAFKGIHYAQSTAGSNRFQAPKPLQSWSGVVEALTYGRSAPQTNPLAPPGNNGMDNSPAGEGEDCLVLNVWTPALDRGKRPVMVWFHGGGWNAGSASPATFNGVNLVNRGDVVLVGVNHRLGLMGYLYLGEHGGDPASGSAGVLDMVAALQWVKDNIEQFGGDPGNVTIFGESGGAVKVHTLMGLPAARGLFDKAIMESGSAAHWMNHDQGKQIADHVLNYLGVKPPDLYTLPLAKLLEAQFKAIPPRCTPPLPPSGLPGAVENLAFFPVIDGQVMKRSPALELKDGLSSEVALIIGSNKDEAAAFLGRDPSLPGMTEATLRTRLSRLLGNKANAIVDTYRASRPAAAPKDLLVAIGSGFAHYIDTVVIEQEKLPKAQRTAPVYRYQFAHDQPYPNDLVGSGHAMELAFVFDTVAVSPPFLGGAQPNAPDFAARQALAAKVSTAWIAFARTGNPTHPGLPNWPAYSATKRETMMLTDQAEVLNDPLAAEQKAWEGYVQQVPLPLTCS